ncbi:MAG: class I SAM-dependent methyltransferase [Ruminococcaceae bacterium]|nr:class I SAM-dependent methyltransferase [Oscillospiraceae bacterium]
MLNDHNVVQEQYKTGDNLNTRISIHKKYSVNKTGFGNWIFSHYKLTPDIKILELGCGTGDMWKENLHLLNEGIQLYLTDISEGMIASAKNTLGEHTNISYRIADIEAIPYESGLFDGVIANMMLYHVPDLDKGLSEVKRVMSDKGYFYCATYGENGIVPYIAGLLREYGVQDTTNKNFTLQNGYDILKKHFSAVQRFDYEDSLAVTDIDDMLDYIYSLKNMSSVAELAREDIKAVLKKNMVDGVLSVPKENGMFVCQK